MKPLKKIGVVSPASLPKDREVFERGISFLRRKGFSVIIGRSCFEELSDEERAKELVEMMNECDLILCSRGGNGSYRLLDYLPPPSPTPICGYSDITALLLWKVSNGQIAYHGPMVCDIGYDERSGKEMLKVVTGQVYEYRKLMNHLTIYPGKASGRLVGGNLSLFVTVMDLLKIEGDVILYLEDVNESLDSIDRMLWKIFHSYLSENIKGLIVGGFTRIRKGDIKKNIIDILRNYASYLKIPAFLGFPSFHGKFFKYTLPLGAIAEMDASQGKVNIVF